MKPKLPSCKITACPTQALRPANRPVHRRAPRGSGGSFQRRSAIAAPASVASMAASALATRLRMSSSATVGLCAFGFLRCSASRVLGLRAVFHLRCRWLAGIHPSHPEDSAAWAAGLKNGQVGYRWVRRWRPVFDRPWCWGRRWYQRLHWLAEAYMGLALTHECAPAQKRSCPA